MPERKKVIVLQHGNVPVGVYGSLKDMCDKNMHFSYHYLKTKSKFPYDYKCYRVYKIKFR